MYKSIPKGGIALTVTLAALLSAGCATKAPPYQPSLDNVQAIKKLPQSLALGVFSVNAGATGAQSIGLRGSSMESPVGANYAAYLADALRQELVLAGKLDPQSKLEISGVLLKNDIDASGFSTASGEIEARFIVKNAGQTRYEKTHKATLNWESSFMGAVAIPKAQQQYPVVVQALITRLFADAEFLAALK